MNEPLTLSDYIWQALDDLERLAELALPVAERLLRIEEERVARMSRRPPGSHSAASMSRALLELSSTQELVELATRYARKETV